MRLRSRTLLLAAVVTALAACSEESAKRDDGGAVVEGGPVGVFQLKVGDCLDDPPDAGPELVELDALAARPCEEPHDNEVFALVDLEGDDDAPFPGTDAVVEAGEGECLAAFEPYVGAPYETSALEFSVYVFPTEETWTQLDDREVVCALFAVSGDKLTGSMEGSGR